jgi:predicted nucleic acid-binding protein
MLPLRLVIDTNIVVSAALKPDGLQLTIVLLSITKPARLYTSAAILFEYRDVLSRPELRIRIASDPDDNIFLECADAAGADYLVTGNLRHFPRFWKKTKIITSRELMGLVAPHLAPRRL